MEPLSEARKKTGHPLTKIPLSVLDHSSNSTIRNMAKGTKNCYHKNLREKNMKEMKIPQKQIITFLLFPLFILSITGNVMATEEAKYAVLEKDGHFELRLYEPCIVAETLVEGDFDEVGSAGFRRLFRYISGDNQTKKTISMTAPVAQEMRSEKISMTAPVTQKKEGKDWSIAFVMPAEYTMDSLPIPNDAKITLRAIPARLVAAITYSGTWSESRYEEHKALLDQMMSKRRLKPAGEYIYARYNPPFTPWFMRRNEVLVPVERIQ
jgi:hypothetical protein